MYFLSKNNFFLLYLTSRIRYEFWLGTIYLFFKNKIISSVVEPIKFKVGLQKRIETF